MDNVRYNISPCSSEEAEAFIRKIDKSVYEPRGAVKADEHSHYDRYSFMRDDCKIAAVYDTLANVISITAPKTFADELLAVFGKDGKAVKSSTVPAQNSIKRRVPNPSATETAVREPVHSDTRAKLFVTPESIRRRPARNTATVIATSKGLEISTDEIFPPQRAKKRPENSSGNGDVNVKAYNGSTVNKGGSITSVSAFSGGSSVNGSVRRQKPPMQEVRKSPSVEAYFAEKQANKTVGRTRKATISFGDEDDDEVGGKVLQRSGTGLFADLAQHRLPDIEQQSAETASPKRKRGRPRKATADADIVKPPAFRDEPAAKPDKPEYKNGYSVRNYPPEKLSALLKRLRADNYAVKTEETEFKGTPQEVSSFCVSDAVGAKVVLRYATNKKTLQLQGRRSELFGEVQSQVSMDSDYSSALEGYVGQNESGGNKTDKVTAVEKMLKKRLPTAYEYLSEQSRIDFSYGIHDFAQNNLQLSDYSVLLVPAFRGLERFVFDLQLAEGIKVKMIGQAYDKDDSGNYILKRGYSQRIGSVIYSEVMVALYTEYFSRRNFFAHSDNTDESKSRALPDRAAAKAIFESLLDTVEYNARKLKEIGFSLDGRNG